MPYHDVDPRRYDVCQNLYVRFEKPVSSKLAQALDALTKALAKSNERHVSPFDLDVSLIGRKMSEEITRVEGRLAAYRLAEETLANDPFLKHLAPEGILNIKSTAIHFSKTRQETKTSWTYQAHITGTFELIRTPSNEVLLTGPFATAVGAERADGSEPSDDFLNELQNKALAEMGRDLVRRLFPVQLLRVSRPTFKKEEEETLWKKYFNMAVTAEMKKDYPTAQNYYQLSEEAAVGSAEAKKIKWETINKTMFDMVRQPPKPDIKDHWFTKRIVVLPFSDEVVNVDAPDLVRDTVFNALKKNGYIPPPMTEIDEILRQHGFTDGGQFKAVSKEKLAAWTKADILLFCHLEEFNEINIGIYRKRVVKGQFSLWNPDRKEDLWTSEVAVSNQDVAIKGDQAAANFLGGLAQALAERLKKKPLGAEVAAFTRQFLETLPAR